jgi:hypothetical protein
MPVARNVWLPIFVPISAPAARRWIIAKAFAWGRGVLGQFAGASANGAEKRSLLVIAESATVDIGVQVGFEIVMVRHRMKLAAFLMEANPETPVLNECVLWVRAGARWFKRRPADSILAQSRHG